METGAFNWRNRPWSWVRSWQALGGCGQWVIG